MSLYGTAPNSSNSKLRAIISSRPIWLTAFLAFAAIYAMTALTQLVINHNYKKEIYSKVIESNKKIRQLGMNDQNLEKSMGRLESTFSDLYIDSAKTFPTKIIVHSLLFILSAIYFFKPISAIGFAAASIWLGSLLAMCSLRFSMEISAADYLLVLPHFGLDLGAFSDASDFLKPITLIAIFVFSSIKVRSK